MKPLEILRTAIANTFRSKLRTTLTVVAIFIGAFTLTITNGLGTGISNYIDSQVAGGAVVEIAVDSTAISVIGTIIIAWFARKEAQPAA